MKKKIIFLITIVIGIISYCFGDILENELSYETSYDLSSIPSFNGKSYVVLNNNEPEFTDEEINKEPYENYSKLDYLDRCGPATAKIDYDMMPTEPRGPIGMIKPTGWHTVKYDFVDGKYLYNRCHLIAYQLTGENANEQNLITCTRYANTEGMLPFENQVADYIEKTKNTVLYRVTPIFEKDNLLASGIQMEALSVEDNGKGIKFNVYVYNVQENVTIDYTTGKSEIVNR